MSYTWYLTLVFHAVGAMYLSIPGILLGGISFYSVHTKQSRFRDDALVITPSADCFSFFQGMLLRALERSEYNIFCQIN